MRICVGRRSGIEPELQVHCLPVLTTRLPTEFGGRRDFYVRTESPFPSSSHRILDQREGLHFLRRNTNGGVTTPLFYLELTKLLILSASFSISAYVGNSG
jgi:hypothetical protein